MLKQKIQHKLEINSAFLVYQPLDPQQTLTFPLSPGLSGSLALGAHPEHREFGRRNKIDRT